MVDGGVAWCGRKNRLAEEVPGLSIRRLTLEDPRSARELTGSRSNSPVTRQCNARKVHTPSQTNTSSYRWWLERMRKERPPFLTIVSLELPESPVPLIASQEVTRSTISNTSEEFVNDNDKILDELLQKVSDVTKRARRRGKRDQSAEPRPNQSAKVSSQQRSRAECTRNVRTLQECTRHVTYGQTGNDCPEKAEDPEWDVVDECICSEIPANLRIDIRKKSEFQRSADEAVSTPEVTHTIRIAMKYQGQGRCKLETEEEKDSNSKKSLEEFKEEGCCGGVNVALDFTLNCNGVRLTSRDVSLKTNLTREDNRAS